MKSRLWGSRVVPPIINNKNIEVESTTLICQQNIWNKPSVLCLQLLCGLQLQIRNVVSRAAVAFVVFLTIPMPLLCADNSVRACGQCAGFNAPRKSTTAWRTLRSRCECGIREQTEGAQAVVWAELALQRWACLRWWGGMRVPRKGATVQEGLNVALLPSLLVLIVLKTGFLPQVARCKWPPVFRPGQIKDKFHTCIWSVFRPRATSLYVFSTILVLWLTTKNVHFVKLSKCEMDFTIAFLSSRRSKNIYGTSNSKSGWRSYALGKMPCCREFRPKSRLPGSLKKSARVSGVIPTSGVPTKVGSSDCQECWPKSGLPTYLTENPVRIWPFGFWSELFQTREKLGK